jgi:5-(carboxyamino)imidazole ribonucleotide synthase
MKAFEDMDFNLAILGGGQLGKMLLQAASPWNIQSSILDPNKDCPAATHCSNYTQGDFNNYQDVLSFGQHADYITIEIENVNTEALSELERQGKTVCPAPEIIRMIQDKGLQKTFYQEHRLPTSAFTMYENAETVRNDLQHNKLALPFVQKLRKEGYDGRGVQVIRHEKDLDQLFDRPSIVEPLVNIQKELAIIVARNKKGEVRTFPAIEMEFNTEVNLVDYLFSPAAISHEISSTADQIAVHLANALQLQGILAVELFLTDDQQLLINEVAPRPHNSGHHTIEANITSQYEQALRAIFNLSLGSTTALMPSAMVNLLGAENFEGEAHYEGIAETMSIEGSKVHLYGKKQTKPYRKMGHVTILDSNLERAKQKALQVKERLIVKTKS